jgi:hypothetical protein
VSAVGGYLWFGDFYKSTVSGEPEVKNAWTSYAKINYAY